MTGSELKWLQGTILDMVEDVTTALGWISSHIQAYGGNPQQTLVVGQSAGAQLAALAVLLQASKAAVKCTVNVQANSMHCAVCSMQYA